MILSERLREEIDKIKPEKRELTVEESRELHLATCEKWKIVSWEYAFSSEDNAISYDYSGEGESSRWENIILLPLYITWELLSIDGANASFAARLQHSGRTSDYQPRDFWMQELRKVFNSQPMILALPETTVEIPHPTWLADKLNEPALFLASEAADYVARYRKVLESLPVLV